jgi:hypothetical protein
MGHPVSDAGVNILINSTDRSFWSTLAGSLRSLIGRRCGNQVRQMRCCTSSDENMTGSW